MKHSVRVSLAAVACILVGSSVASAQAQRTWVSGVGDDANPCSRTAPCKTFAGAISKTAAGGEISVLDPGGYGAVTITKSITINGYGALAGIQATGTNGIIINAAGGDVVKLLHLSLQGNGTGVAGIRYVAGGQLVVDDVFVSGFQTGIESLAGNATVTNSLFTHNSVVAVHARLTSTLTIENSLVTANNVAAQASDTSTLRMSNNGFYNNLTGFGCGGGTLASAGNNRKAGNVGGTVPVCAPTVAVTVQ